MAAPVRDRHPSFPRRNLVNRTQQLEELCQAVLDGSATDGDAAELQEILRHDAGARRIYWEHVRLHQALEMRFARSSALPSRSGVLEFPAPRRNFPAGIAAAAVVLLGAAMWIFWGRERPAATYRVAKQSIFQVEHANGAKVSAGTLMPGSRLHLQQGEVELEFAGGSRAVVLGPADLKLDSALSLKMNRGNGWFHVSRKDRGFRIVTPELDLVDHGTDFGVSVNLLDPDEIHVFSGEVDAAARSGGETKRLTTGMARSAGESGLAEIELKPDSFARSIGSGLPYLHFSFDSLEKGRFPVDGTLPETKTIHAAPVAGKSPPTLVPGVSGQALRLSGSGDAVTTDWPGISGISPRTVSFWLRVDRANDLTRLPSIVGWGDYRLPRGKWKILLDQARRDAPAYPRISFGEYAYDAPLATNDGRWHHLAFSYTGTAAPSGHPDIAIHIDGVKQHPVFRNYTDQPFQPGLPATATTGGNSQPLGIATAIDASPCAFSGEIDELKIYTGVLSDADIRAEFEAGNPPKN